jgi:tetratricopeptide (TPR) repeat protein
LTYEDLTVIRKRAPYVRILIDGAVKYRYQDKATFDDLQREYGHIAPYDVGAAWKIANAARNDPERFIQLIEDVAPMDPEALRTLGSYLADRERDEEARRAYERYLASARNSIAMSGSSYWLVRHYFLRGEHARATALAERAADVYSYRGLVTRADLHDWRGETRDAEEYYRRVATRYDDASELAGFYLRHGRTGEEPARLLRNAFPDGLKRVSFPSLTTAPTEGVVLNEVGCAGEGAGLRDGDIVIAVDGILVRSYNQYRVARGARNGDAMQLTVWRNGRYLEVPTKLRYIWTESYLQDYPDPRLRQ